MGNIWEFLLQTLTVSLTAAVLLIVKYLLADKLSPRWQYGIWGLLALRALIPAGMTRQVLLPLPAWVDMCKTAAERGLASAYAGPWDAMDAKSVLPWPSGAPESVTDWLFVAYALGAAAYLLWKLAAYIRLRLALRRGAPASEAVSAQIAGVCEKYGLRASRAVEVEGLPTAFVCGVFWPVLAVPKGGVDDKVLLHELLHLKYFDAAQGIFWCLVRALHWCNPFMHYVLDRVGNDLESLCDQRVLERLEGEERREYGGILLGMANEKYARAPGTSSISNGGRNISRRIAAIVRFKLYPRGMALASVCIAIVLATPCCSARRARTRGTCTLALRGSSTAASPSRAPRAAGPPPRRWIPTLRGSSTITAYFSPPPRPLKSTRSCMRACARAAPMAGWPITTRPYPSSTPLTPARAIS